MYPNQYEVDAKRDDMMRRAEQERLANRARSENYVSFRRAVELLVGLLQTPNRAPRPQPEVVEPTPQPSKLATDSGIHRIR